MRFCPLIFVIALLATASAAVPAKRPNVVIFITDDESWLERSAYGWSKLPTPYFDRVAREGALFTRAYCSAPSCAPARAALLTGRNFWELEQGAFIQAWLPAKFPTLPELMEAAGYRTGFTGKGWGPGVLPESGRKRNPAGAAYNTVKRRPREEGLADIDYPANFAKFLDERKAGEPFWFWIGAQEPHAPWAKGNHAKLASEFGVSQAAVPVPGFLPDTPGIRIARANMLYEMCRVDRDLGRVLALLEERGELANTLLIVTADNGTDILRAKTNLYDWGLHVPLAVMWPARMPPGRTVDDFVSFADLAPTILEAAGQPVPRAMSGRSALDVFLSDRSGRIDPQRSWVAGGLEWHGEAETTSLAGRMIRDERYQYIVNYGATPRQPRVAAKERADSAFAQSRLTDDERGLVSAHPLHPQVAELAGYFTAARPREELYDLKTDPWQTKNLATAPAHAATKARLKGQLEAYQLQTRDPRATGEMELFERTRRYVLNRKYGEGGYAEK